ncbi:MAG TPA: Gfo/Idh/MocA family oxidoreductase [Acidobacteria bacterium]|nr:Gfo/Idh/MocA family oxidoreductase [Acidobacteriota bacterium]HIN12126.1 Gfo/Idh/MocA family oxidoreductase [Acidobacteriota bacterium]
MSSDRLGIGFIGSGFITRFHIQSMVGVREADVLGVWSPNDEHAEAAAALARDLDVGAARAFASIEALVADPAVDAVWLCGPNHTRVANIDAICAALTAGATLRGVACEKPLARTVAEAKRIKTLVDEAGLSHGYLENQLFAPAVTRGRELLWRRGAALTGRPYLARAAEEHSGPHMPWFWRGDLQGGGVLNDMMCHSIEVVRHLLTAPGAPRASIRPRRITGHIASLKWTRPAYRDKLRRTMGERVNYRAHPAEDFASVTVEYEADDGAPLVGEASTSWDYVGAGLRLSMELLGPEYSMSFNTLDSGLKLFFSREVRGEAGEDLVEKQNAEVGLMPVVADEVGEYGYTAENRHMARAFLHGETPDLTFDDGVEVVELLMTAYMSAEQERTLSFRPDGLDAFVPAVAKGTWTGGGAH